MDTAKPTDERHVANLSYLATGDAKTAFEFSRSGFVVFVTVTPSGDGSLQVRLLNQGNVKPGKLPVL
jgi:hypothetical protein